MKLTKKQKKKMGKLLLLSIILLIALLTGIIKREEVIEILGIKETIEKEESIEENRYLVTRVIDGDTFEIKVGEKKEKIRLIGIDTPESVHPDSSKNTKYGTIASNYTKDLIENKTVTLEFDVQQRDKYGRLLAYVYLEDGSMLNKKLLEEGYAQIATYPPNVKQVDNFKEAEQKAREEKKGFWKEKIF